MSNLSIAIISADTLSALGIKNILQNMFSISMLHFCSFKSFEGDNPDRFDIIITDSANFVANVDFFIPRRSKTIVVTDSVESRSSFYQVNCHSDESSIIEAIGNFISRLQCAETTQTELTQREIDVLKLIASGHLNKEIADTLQISINTVLSHRKNITAKLGIRSASGLSVYAMMNGYLTNL